MKIFQQTFLQTKLLSLLLAALLISAAASLRAGNQFIASLAAEKTANVENREVSAAAKQDHKADPIEIMASIRPLAFMIEAVIPSESKRYWNVNILVPPQSSAHGYQLKPSDILKLRQAHSFIWLGHGAEPEYSKVVKRFSVASAPLTDAQLEWIPLREQDHELELDHDHGHSHGEDGLDPHIWLSLPQAPDMLRYIANNLIETLNDKKLQNKMQWTDTFIADQQQSIRQGLASALHDHEKLMGRINTLRRTWAYNKYISFHNAFAYLDAAFKVESLGSFVQNPDDGISPRHLRDLQAAMKDEQLGCLFTEPAADGRQIDSFLPEGLSIVDLDILGTSLPSGVDWIGYWEYMVEQMQVCFGSPALSIPEEEREIELPLRPVEKDEQRIIDKLKFYE